MKPKYPAVAANPDMNFAELGLIAVAPLSTDALKKGTKMKVRVRRNIASPGDKLGPKAMISKFAAGIRFPNVCTSFSLCGIDKHLCSRSHTICLKVEICKQSGKETLRRLNASLK